VAAGAKVHARNNAANPTPKIVSKLIHYSFDHTEALVTGGAKVDVRNASSATSLHLASQKSHPGLYSQKSFLVSCVFSPSLHLASQKSHPGLYSQKSFL
jgi:hypothetical protein